MKFCISLPMVFMALLLNGCTQQATEVPNNSGANAAEPTAINAHCPIMGSAVTDDGGRYDWDGKTVGFCCPECIEAFADMSDDEKTTALAEADKPDAAGGTHGHSHEEHGHTEEEAS